MEDYKFETDYWGDCTNTLDEEQKQCVYAKYMQLTPYGHSWYVGGKKILDIGGGPVSLLLKAANLKEGLVVDPINYPDWTKQRYAIKNINVIVKTGEDITEEGFDEVWIYNCLQHVIDPERIIKNALRSAKVLRIFEWIDIPAHEGHPHMLTEEKLNEWIGSNGNTVQLSESGCFGRAYYNVYTTLIDSEANF